MNVPKLRFKEFNDEWRQINLKETFIYLSTNSLSREQLSDKGILKNLHYGDIHRKYNSIVNENDDITTYVKDLNYINKYEKIKENDLIFADASEDYDGIGKAVEVINIKNDTISGLHTILAREKEKIFAPMFKGYYFNSYIIHNQIRVLANGFKVYGISKDSINKLNVKIPTINEQKKIANTLNLLDKKIELQSRKIEDLKLFKKGLLSIFLDKNIERSVKLANIAIFKNGKGHENIVNDNGSYVLVNSKFISTDGKVSKYCNNQLSPLYKNDIVMVMSDLPKGKVLAKCFIIDKNNLYSLNQRICSLTIDKNCDPYYIFYKINRNPYYLKFDDGVNQTNLKKEDVLNLIIDVPNLNNQKKYSKYLIQMDKKIYIENKKVLKLQELKKGLMQSMFV